MTPDQTTRTLGDGLPKELARCQELLEIYKELGPAGAFGHAVILVEIRAAQKALAEGDLVAMLRAYESLKACE